MSLVLDSQPLPGCSPCPSANQDIENLDMGSLQRQILDSYLSSIAGVHQAVADKLNKAFSSLELTAGGPSVADARSKGLSGSGNRVKIAKAKDSATLIKAGSVQAKAEAVTASKGPIKAQNDGFSAQDAAKVSGGLDGDFTAELLPLINE